MKRANRVEYLPTSDELHGFEEVLDAMLEELLGRRCHFALAVAVDDEGALTVSRLSNSPLSDARTLFEIAALVPVSSDSYRLSDWPDREAN